MFKHPLVTALKGGEQVITRKPILWSSSRKSNALTTRLPRCYIRVEKEELDKTLLISLSVTGGINEWNILDERIIEDDSLSGSKEN